MRLRRGSMLLRSGSSGSKAATQRSKFNAPAARFKWFNAATQRFKRFKSCYAAFKVQCACGAVQVVQCCFAAVQVVQCCFAAFKIQREAQGPYTLRSSFTRSSAALHAEGFTRAVGALPAPQVLYTRFSALNA
jgi:hypothetical protein